MTFNSQVLLDGILGAIPYLLLAVVLWSFSPIGVICGLLFGQFHVWWRHTTILGGTTPKIVTVLCQLIFITTPERHWIHHQKPNQAYGDIFTFFEEPAKVWWRWLRLFRVYLKRFSIALSPYKLSASTNCICNPNSWSSRTIPAAISGLER